MAATAAGGAGLWRGYDASSGSVLDARVGPDLVEPATISSREGRDVRLEAAAGVNLAGRRTAAYGYNGTSPGPTLRVRRGDVLRVELVNRLDVATNLHTHGLHVSPEGNGDNIFVQVAPGESFRYEYRIPDDHPVGTFWYYPHVQGRSRSRSSAAWSVHSSSTAATWRSTATACSWSPTRPWTRTDA